jgi:HAD superfamily hydrolase (TIGR01484 family)
MHGHPPSPLAGVRLVALDLDGTLLPSDKRLTPRAVRVVRALRDAGIDVTLATGKGWNLTRGYSLELGLTAPIVALEGAFVARATQSGAETVRSHTHSPATRAQHHGLVEDLELGWFYTHTGQRTRIHRRLAHRRDQVAVWDPHIDTVDEPLHDHHEDPFVVHLVGAPEGVGEALARVRDAALADVDLFHAEFWDGYHQLQVRAAGVGKHTALAHTLEHLGLASCELLAAGDWLNPTFK